MPRRPQNIFYKSLVAAASLLALTACQQSQHQAKKTAAPVIHKHYQVAKPVKQKKTVALATPEGPFIVVIDASSGQIKHTGERQATLTIPANKMTQVGYLYMDQEPVPHYYNKGLAQDVWAHTPQNAFAGSHAILSSSFLKPHSVKILSEKLEQNNLVLELKTSKPLHYTRHLRQVVLNISNSK
jgi:hypothetical protein